MKFLPLLILLLLNVAANAQPVIDHLYVHAATDRLFIYGSFDTSAKVVSINSVTSRVILNNDSLVIAELPSSGLGSDGPVKVSDNSGESNIKLISSWWLRVNEGYSSHIGPTYSEYSIQFRLHLRADIESYREGFDPRLQRVALEAGRSSECSYRVDERNFDPYVNLGYSVSGAGNLPWVPFDSAMQEGFKTRIRFDGLTKEFTCYDLAILAPTNSTYDNGNPGPSGNFGREFEPIYVKLNDSLSIIADEKDLSYGREEHGISWRQDSAAWVPLRSPYADSLQGSRALANSAYTQIDSSILHGEVFAVAVHNNENVVAGWLVRANNDTINNIAVHRAGKWQRIGEGFNKPVRALASFQGELYAAGDFDSSGARRIPFLARWDGQAWQAVDVRISGRVNKLVLTSSALYAVGYFRQPGAFAVQVTPTECFPVWDSSESPDAELRDLSAESSNIHVVGGFDSIGESQSTGLATFNLGTRTWKRYNLSLPRYSQLHSVWASADMLYVGGRFDSIAGIKANNIACFKENLWFPLGGGVQTDNSRWQLTFANVRTLFMLNDKLYVAGEFLNGPRLRDTANSLAAYDLTTQDWMTFGNGIERFADVIGRYCGRVNSMVPSNGYLLLGGYFALAGSKPASNVAKIAIPSLLRLKQSSIKSLENATVYPNPVTGRLRLRLEGTSECKEGTVLTTNGVRVAAISNVEESVDVSFLPAGQYFINLDCGQIAKFIKE